MMVNFTELTGIEGVLDCLLCDRRGELIFPHLQYKNARIAQIGREVAFCSAFLDEINETIDTVEVIYGSTRIIMRISHNFSLVVICEEGADVPLINLTLNVIIEEIKRDKKIQRFLGGKKAEHDMFLEAKKQQEWNELSEKMSTLGARKQKRSA